MGEVSDLLARMLAIQVNNHISRFRGRDIEYLTADDAKGILERALKMEQEEAK